MSNHINYLFYIQEIINHRFNDNLEQAALELNVSLEHLNSVLNLEELPNYNLVNALGLTPQFSIKRNCCNCKYSSITKDYNPENYPDYATEPNLECGFPESKNKGEYINDYSLDYFDEYDEVAQDCSDYTFLVDNLKWDSLYKEGLDE